MKNKGKLLSIMLVALVLVSLLSFPVSAKSVTASGKCSDTLSWTLYSDGELVIAGNGPMYDWCWWDTNVGYGGEYVYAATPWNMYKNNIVKVTVKSGVETVGSGAFTNHANLQSVVLEPGVKDVRIAAFEGCTSLSEITLPQGVHTIGDGVFLGCTGLRNVSLPQGLMKIETYAFKGCTALTKISIPQSVITIGASAFEGCPLTEVEISENVIIGYGAFTCKFSETSGKCGPNAFWNLENGVLTISGYGKTDDYNYGDRGGRQWYSPFNGLCNCGYYSNYECKAIKTFIISEGITSVGQELLGYPLASFEHNQDIYVASTVKILDNDICYHSKTPTTTTIHYYGTEEDWNKMLSQGDYKLDVTGRGDNWVLGTKKYELPGDEYGYYKDNMKKIQVVYLGKPVPGEVVSGMLGENIKWTLFTDNRLVIEGTGAMPDFAAGEAPWFAYANRINEVVISEGVTNIGACAFFFCNKIYNLLLPESLTSIGHAAFHGCTGLGAFTVPQNVTFLDSYAFYGCSGLKHVTLYPLMTYIGDHAFEGCSGIESINLHDAITYLGDYAFSGCARLKHATIPGGVTEVRPYVFDGCSGLTKIDMHSRVTIADSTAFRGCNCKIYIRQVV